MSEDFNQEIKLTCQKWQAVHQALLTTANRQQREKLLFQECQLERHVQRLMASYCRWV